MYVYVFVCGRKIHCSFSSQRLGAWPFWLTPSVVSPQLESTEYNSPTGANSDRLQCARWESTRYNSPDTGAKSDRVPWSRQRKTHMRAKQEAGEHRNPSSDYARSSVSHPLGALWALGKSASLKAPERIAAIPQRSSAPRRSGLPGLQGPP